MKFTVRWKLSARNELADLWLQADSSMRHAITAAAHQIERDLQKNPVAKGESRDGAERVLFVFPLGVRFEVDAAQAVVRVLQVWSFRRRG